jgi:hypothetical protein
LSSSRGSEIFVEVLLLNPLPDQAWLWFILALPFALLVLLIVVEPRRQASGKEQLGYYGCILHIMVLSLLMSPLGYLLWLVMGQIAEMF